MASLFVKFVNDDGFYLASFETEITQGAFVLVRIGDGWMFFVRDEDIHWTNVDTFPAFIRP
jgi:hypothetical protein